jgi:hypothetical protein
MGNFYEAITQGLYGGERTVIMGLCNQYKEEHMFKPDLVDRTHHKFWESKAIHSSHGCQISDPQLSKYADLQFVNPRATINYVFYRHRHDKIKSFKGTPHELFTSLSEKTLCSVVIPLSLVMALHKNRDSESTSRYENLMNGGRYVRGTYPDCTVVKSRIINGLFIDSEDTMHRIAVDPRDYVVRKILSPENMSVDGVNMKSFPITIIADRDHHAWVEQFRHSFEPQSDVALEDEEFDGARYNKDETDSEMDIPF